MDFPAFGLPTSCDGQRGGVHCFEERRALAGHWKKLNSDVGSFDLTKAEAGISESYLDGVAQRRARDNFDAFLAFEQTEFVEPLH